MHYFLIIVVIILIVSVQLKIYWGTIRNINNFKGIFSGNSFHYQLNEDEIVRLVDKINNSNEQELLEMLENSHLDKNDYIIGGEELLLPDYLDLELARAALRNNISDSLQHVSTTYKNDTLSEIIRSLNNYLSNNKSVSDFHLLKDIVDRNCDVKEEEISTQIPVPLYMGLVGTMSGILIGVLYLWLSGGIESLLSVSSNTDVNAGADGVEALLGGVGLAMVASILGILLTTISSNKFKNAKIEFEQKKHIFLSWIQVKLLPTLSDNVVGAIRDMTTNFSAFNNLFSENVKTLDSALSNVKHTYTEQIELLKIVEKIADKDLSSQNLKLYNALSKSATEISTLGEYLYKSNEYLSNVRDLNEKLDSHEVRTKVIETVGQFFMAEIEQVEQRKSAIAKSVGSVDDYLRQALDKLKENTENQFVELQNSTVRQEEALSQKSEELDIIVAELKQLSSVKEIMTELELTTQDQNRKIDLLLGAINSLGEIGIAPQRSNTTTVSEIQIPARFKLLVILGGSALVAIFILMLIALIFYLYNY